MAHEADVARRTRTDAMRHARLRGRACEAHEAQVSQTRGRRPRESSRKPVSGAMWREGGLACEGLTG